VVRQVVQRYCRAAGLDAKLFGAHSLRAGMATQAALNGASERSIMRQTGHKSVTMVRATSETRSCGAIMPLLGL
jgi:integrase